MARTPEQIVRDYCAAVGNRDVATIEALLAEDVEFMNVGLEIFRGRQAVLDHYAAPGGVFDMFPEFIDFRIRNLGVAENRVYTERVDILTRDGITAHLPVLGIFEIEHGKIGYWRDYSDMGMVQRLLRGEKMTAEEGFPPGTEDV